MTASDGMPLHLLSHWETIAKRLEKKRNRAVGVALFLDFDGTLVPVAQRPNLVRLASATRSVLQRLAETKRAKVTIISGRRRAELLKFIHVRRIKFLGLYGWERADGVSLSAAARNALRRVHARLKEQLSAFPRVWIEDKRGSLSVHLLEAAPSVRRLVLNELHMLINPLQTELKLFENLRDAEIVPRSIRGKGLAVSAILRQPAYRKLIPFYFGDDLSDEPAFAAVRRGYSVHVGRAPSTQASFFLRNPGEVTLFLTQLEESLS
jgi:trehalose 6-phosphate phosphatase